MTTYLTHVEANIHVEHSTREFVMARINATLEMSITNASKEALERVHLAMMDRDYGTMFTILAEMCNETGVPSDDLPEVDGRPRGRRITL